MRPNGPVNDQNKALKFFPGRTIVNSGKGVKKDLVFPFGEELETKEEIANMRGR